MGEIKRMSVTADGSGAIFDVPAERLAEVLEAANGEKNENDDDAPLFVPETLPELKERPPGMTVGGFGGGGRGG